MIGKLLRHQTLRQFATFTGCGAIGMFADMAALWVVTELLGAGPYFGRVLSFFSASFVTWALNRALTFRDIPSTDPALRQWAKFVAANAVGACINYAIYALCVTFIPFFAAQPVFAVVPGSAAGLVFNFTASKKLVFR
ncbi:MAG: GtrA family protein [Alphaproteobacteria bacterium]|nr:GtrA family protein [Alphaproteobacteria bacterium]